MKMDDVDKLNASAKYLATNDLLFGSITPRFKLDSQDKFELDTSPLETAVQDSGLEGKSVAMLNLQHTYLQDAENVVKRAQAYDDRG